MIKSDVPVILPPDEFQFPVRGKRGAPIYVLCDTPSAKAMTEGLPMELDLLQLFAGHALKAGFVPDDFYFVAISPPLTEMAASTEKRKWDYVHPYSEKAKALIEADKPAVVMTCGQLATRTMMGGKPVKIMKVRGNLQISEKPETGDRTLVFPVLSPKLVRMQPDNSGIFAADLGTLKRLKDCGFQQSEIGTEEVDYQWVTDLQFLIDNPPRSITLDTETQGADPAMPGFQVLVAQICWAAGKSVAVKLDTDPESAYYCPPRLRAKLIGQLRQIAENPAIIKIAQNFKFDHHALRTLRIETQNWRHDTELMARMVNENMMTYNLADLVRVYVPAMAGYSDEFDRTVDKSNMRAVDPDRMLQYGCGDADATFRLARALYPLLASEPSQLNLYTRVKIPGLLAFLKSQETYGMTIDANALREYETEVETWVNEEVDWLKRNCPATVRRKYMANPETFKFTRDVVVADILFSKEGFRLKPKVFTDSTKALPPDQRVPSVSTKDHLPYFSDTNDAAGEWVRRFIEYKKAEKLLSTYIRGMYKQIKPDGKIYPKYNFRTNTLRTNSQDPNGQNFPKRGQFAKGFRKLIRASNGKLLATADLSQIELRATAVAARERNMLRIYANDGDIHAATAAAVMRVDQEQFMRWKGDVTPLIEVANNIPGSGAYLQSLSPGERRTVTVGKFYDLQRFRAKAVNFGFIYGAQWQTFQTYAKTNYGVDYSDAEAKETRENFFAMYGDLPRWHSDVERYVREHKRIISLHGQIRHLDAVDSPEWGVSTGAIRQAINAPIQGFGSDLGVIAFTRIREQIDPRIMRPIGFIHDDLITEVDPEYAMQALGWLVWVMENPPLKEWFGLELPIPVRSEPELGTSFGEMEEIKRNKIVVEKPPFWNDDEQHTRDMLFGGQGFPEDAYVRLVNSY